MFTIVCFQLYFLPVVDMLFFVEENLFRRILVWFPMASGKGCPFFSYYKIIR